MNYKIESAADDTLDIPLQEIENDMRDTVVVDVPLFEYEDINPAPNAIRLRDYQIATLTKLDKSFVKSSRVILQAVCGAGKTVMACSFIQNAVDDGQSVLFLAHRRELVLQCCEKLTTYGIEHGVLMAGETASLMPSVQVASVQTLLARLRRKHFNPPRADLLVFDECHHNMSNTHLKLIKETYADSKLLGLTATPCRTDGRGLGDLYEDMVFAPTVKQLVTKEHLVPVEYYAPCKPDLKGLKIRCGDFAKDALAERLDKPQLIGDIVENWGRICPDRKTVVFATSVKHSIHIMEQFEKAGVKAGHVDGTTPKPERDDLLKRLTMGDIQVVANCMVLTEGWDCPPVSCLVLARPTKSYGLYLQMAGRVLRPAIGKKNAIIIDHSGAIYEHGFIDMDIDWSLDTSKKIQENVKQKKEKESTPITCGNKECGCIYTGRPDCPVCGWKPKIKSHPVNVTEGNLKKVGRDGALAPTQATQLEKLNFYAELKYIQSDRGYKPGWVGMTFKKKYGHWPRPNISGDPAEPSVETWAFVQKGISQFIRSQRRK